MISALALGFLFGVRHAFDADHLAAVATLVVRGDSRSETIRVGLAWGLGHALTLFSIGTVVLVTGIGFTERLSHLFEATVGLMLIVLGADVVYSAIRNRVHIHLHRQGDQLEHIHVHAHPDHEVHDPLVHPHLHHRDLARRAALVGLVHGLAGSAALIILALGTADSLTLGVSYLAVFGLGSTLGMATLSVTVAVPLKSCTQVRPRLLDGLRIGAGTVSLALGGFAITDSLPLGDWLSLM